MFKRLAIFKDVKYGYDAYSESGLDLSPDYIRISEYVDVDFTLSLSEGMAIKEIENLNKLSEAARAKFNDDMAQMARKKAELLAMLAPMARKKDDTWTG